MSVVYLLRTKLAPDPERCHTRRLRSLPRPHLRSGSAPASRVNWGLVRRGWGRPSPRIAACAAGSRARARDRWSRSTIAIDWILVRPCHPICSQIVGDLVTRAFSMTLMISAKGHGFRLIGSEPVTARQFHGELGVRSHCR